MLKFSRRSIVVSLAFGFVSTATAVGQQYPDPLSMPPSSPPMVGGATAPPTVILSASPVVDVPPSGVQATWYPTPSDPVATAQLAPKHVPAKTRSWFWRRSQGRVLGYPEEFQARPLGAAVYDNYRTMVANGVAARLTLFDFDFVPGTGQLTPRGRIQLAKFTSQLGASPFPLVIENTPSSPGLASVRRYTVLAELAGGPMPVTSDRVIVGVPRAIGISGVDAQIIGANELSRVQQFGPPIPLFSSGVNSPNGGSSGNNTPLPGQ